MWRSYLKTKGVHLKSSSYLYFSLCLGAKGSAKHMTRDTCMHSGTSLCYTGNLPINVIIPKCDRDHKKRPGKDLCRRGIWNGSCLVPHGTNSRWIRHAGYFPPGVPTSCFKSLSLNVDEILWFQPQTLARLSLLHPNFYPKGSDTCCSCLWWVTDLWTPHSSKLSFPLHDCRQWAVWRPPVSTVANLGNRLENPESLLCPARI